MFDEYRFDVLSFHYVDDAGELHAAEDQNSPGAAMTFDLDHGCGIFELKKRVG